MNWIVSHDAGGAEVVSAWLKHNPFDQCRFVLEGPALKVFARRFTGIRIESRVSLWEIQKGDFVLTGTSWQSDLERRALEIAGERGTRTASFLEHWTNYRERFQEEGKDILPSEIWLGDDDALRLARPLFPNIQLKRVENCYLREIREEIESISQSRYANRAAEKTRILYVHEAISEHLGRDSEEILEYRAIRHFMNWLRDNCAADKIETIRFRSHPAEDPNKYTPLLNEITDFRVEKSAGTTLAEDCAWSDWVVGISSMALVIALFSGRKIFSCIPPGSPVQCNLPLTGINHI